MEEESRCVRFNDIFPTSVDFFSWLINLNSLSHSLQSIDYQNPVAFDSPEVDRAVSYYLMHVCRDHVVLEKTLAILQPEIEYYDKIRKEMMDEDYKP